METRKQGIHRLTNFELPSKHSSEYISSLYLFRNLRDIFNLYIKKGNCVFDIGCGNKPYEKYIRELIKCDIETLNNVNGRVSDYYVGCDVVQSSEKKVDIICDATNIPVESSSYDIVICTQVIEHIFDHTKVFEEAHRLLKPNGFFIVSGSFVWGMHEVPYDFYRFTKYGFRQLLKNTGFTIKEEKASGGKFAVLGQILLQILYIPHKPHNNFFQRKFYTLMRRCMNYFCNHFLLMIDQKCKDEDAYTLNYVYVGEKCNNNS
jgi:SAM-dependent methyltransferase